MIREKGVSFVIAGDQIREKNGKGILYLQHNTVEGCD